MFGGRLSFSIGLLGIDWGSRAMRLLQVRQHEGMLHVVGAAEEQLPVGDEQEDGPSLAERIRAAVASGGFTGRRCVMSLPRTDLCIQSVRLPKMSDAELHQAAAWEASQRFGFDRDAMEVDVLRTGASLQSGESREEVLIVAASHAVIKARLQPILDAGLRPVAIDTNFAALGRIFSRQYRREGDRQTVRGLLEVGSSGSTVMILRGDQISFCKPIAIGGKHFNEAVADHLQMNVDAAAELRKARIAQHSASKKGTCNVEDASTERAVYEAVRPLIADLVKEVTLCLRYYGVTFRGRPPSQMIVAGGDGLESHLGEVLSNACKIPVVFDDEEGTLAGLSEEIKAVLNRTSGPSSCWAIAAGLSIRELNTSQSAPRPAGAVRGAA